jgi:ubiquinone/menaquinone biosynthesis C-methylase UbiE
VWAGYLLASPIRKLLQNPRKILSPYIREGMTVLDVGSAMGFFSLPMAAMVGPSGKVVCVDLQPGMLQALERRTQKARLSDRIEIRQCSQDSLRLGGLEGRIDFALAFAVIHEVPDTARLFTELCATLKQGGSLLMAEPTGHVRPDAFERSLAEARAAGFEINTAPPIRRSLTALLRKPAGG